MTTATLELDGVRVTVSLQSLNYQDEHRENIDLNVKVEQFAGSRDIGVWLEEKQWMGDILPPLAADQEARYAAPPPPKMEASS